MSSCSENKTETTSTKSPKIDLKLIETHMAELASDKFEGRMPCTSGGKTTIDYIEKELKKIGLEPSSGDSYLQKVPLIDIVSTAQEVSSVQTPKGKMELKRGKDIVLHSERKQDALSLSESELVFCGYGIVDKARGWNDYAGLDMKGKTAVVLVNDPGYGSEDSTFFKGNTMTYFGRWTYKYDEADNQGADGLIIIHETQSAGYPWPVVESSWSGSQQGLAAIDRSNDCGIKGWLHLDKAKQLFDNAGLDLKTLIREARKPGFKPVSLKSTLSTSLTNEYTECDSYNVAAILKGKKEPEEYVVYTAHWDHLGIGKVMDGDSIYNGALDNASGTATVLAIAEGFAKAKTKPDRSTVFLFVTAEEQGLLGSEYYVENPLYPLEKTVANLNMDGVNPAGKMKDLTIVGYGHSEMDDIAEKFAKEEGRYVIGEQEPEKGYFFRSDQFNFAKKGVPVLYGEGGYDHAEKGKEYAKSFKETYIEKNYHAPSDEFNPKTWNFEGMEQDGQLLLNIGWYLSTTQVWPKWKKSSEFSR